MKVVRVFCRFRFVVLISVSWVDGVVSFFLFILLGVWKYILKRISLCVIYGLSVGYISFFIIGVKFL